MFTNKYLDIVAIHIDIKYTYNILLIDKSVNYIYYQINKLI